MSNIPVGFPWIFPWFPWFFPCHGARKHRSGPHDGASAWRRWGPQGAAWWFPAMEKHRKKPMEIGFFYDFHGILLEMAIRLPCWLQIQLFWKHMEYVWIRRVIHGGILYAFIFIWVTEVYWCLFSLFFVRVSKICLTCTWHNFNLSFLVLEGFSYMWLNC